jgi:PAS domain S-box-containing protein
MTQNNQSDILIRLGKFDDYKGPICLNVHGKKGCKFCNEACNGLSSKIIIDALSLDKKNLYFEEKDSFYQATNILLPNPHVRGNFDKYSIIFKLNKDIGKIRTDLLMRIRKDFKEKSKEIGGIGETGFAIHFSTSWENKLKKLKFVTEFEEERLRTEAALNKANEILTANNLIIKFNIDGNLTFLNPFAEKFFGYASDEILGKNIIGTLLPELNIDGEPYTERLKLLVENPENFEFRELESILKDGTSKWVAWTNKSIYDKEGKIIEILSVGLDITSLKRTEQKLASEKALVQLYFDIAGVMLIVLDNRLRISKINKKGKQLLGYNEEELIGLDWCENFIPEKDRKSLKKKLEDVRYGKNEFNKNYILNKDGETKLIFWQNTPIFDENGNFDGILGSGDDITEQKEAEKKLIKEKAIKTLKDQMF